MNMIPHVDTEARVVAHPFEQPDVRFGLDGDGNPVQHIARNEVPAINPEVLDFIEQQEAAEAAEAAFLASMAETRRGEIAVAATVTVDTDTAAVHERGSYYL